MSRDSCAKSASARTNDLQFNRYPGLTGAHDSERKYFDDADSTTARYSAALWRWGHRTRAGRFLELSFPRALEYAHADVGNFYKLTAVGETFLEKINEISITSLVAQILHCCDVVPIKATITPRFWSQL